MDQTDTPHRGATAHPLADLQRQVDLLRAVVESQQAMIDVVLGALGAGDHVQRERITQALAANHIPGGQGGDLQGLPGQE